MILTQALIVGIAAASLIFLAAYGGMISLAQTMLMGTAGFMIGNMVTDAGRAASRRGSTLGWDPTLVARARPRRARPLLGLLFGALAARSTGIYFLMITLTLLGVGFYFVGQVTVVSGLLRDRGHQPVHAAVRRRHRQRPRPPLLHRARRRDRRLRRRSGCVVRTPFGLGAAGRARRAGADELARVRRAGAPDARLRLRRRSSRRSPACCSSGGRGRSRRATSACQSTIDLLIVAVIGGLTRIEGAWVGALAFIVINNYVRDSWLTDLLDEVRHRRQLQHDHRAHLPRHSDRLTRWADGALGQAVGAHRRGGDGEGPSVKAIPAGEKV